MSDFSQKVIPSLFLLRLKNTKNMNYISEVLFQAPENIAVTGRISSWLSDVKEYQSSTSFIDRLKDSIYNKKKYRRLPVSCTVYVVDDNMDETLASIEQSWLFTSHGLRNAAGISIHLSNLRPEGTTSKHGLVASGPCSFAQLYSKLNEILRRGGIYKNGAINLHLDYDHPDIVEFATMSRDLIPWARRTINVDDNFLNLNDYTLNIILKSVERGDCFLVKKQFDRNGNRLYHNVCLEVLLDHRGTCLLAHVNLGKVKIGDGSILKAFTEGTEWLCKLHPHTGVGDSGFYLKPEEDKQVGLGVLGLANLLAIEGIKYHELVTAMEEVYIFNKYHKLIPPSCKADSKEFLLATELYEAYKAASTIAKKYKMKRAFCIAPTASCSFQNSDRELFTTAPEIAPPVSSSIERESQTLGPKDYDYNPDCEIAEEVGWEVYFRLNCIWQSYMDVGGLAHAISTNWWSDKVIMNKSFITSWINSPLKSLYYAWQVTPDTQDKSQIISIDSMNIEEEADSPVYTEETIYNTECIPCRE